MTRPTKLDLDTVRTRLASLTGWTLVPGDIPAITRTFEHPTFAAGIEFVRKIADIADQMDHHPDIDIRYRKVTLTLSTHDASGITELDLAQAARASSLFAP